MLRILVETARYNRTVPCDHRIVPETPAMIGVVAFEDIVSAAVFFIATVFFVCRDQLVRIVCIIIDLRCLEPNIVHPDLLCQLSYIIYLVLVVPDNQKL